MSKVLVVCSGNLCRSPMAAGYLKNRFEQMELDDEVESAGTHAVVGESATPQARQVAAEQGFDIDDHAARRVTPEIVREAEIVLVMEKMHLEIIDEMAAQGDNKLKLLGEFDPMSHDGMEIPDPYGSTIEAYRDTFMTMRPCLDSFILWWITREDAQ